MMDKLPLFKSHKLVRAAPVIWVGGDIAGRTKVMLSVQGEPLNRLEIEVDSEVFARGRPQPGSYIVIYEDNYTSWSPKDVFEAGYKTAAAQEDDALACLRLLMSSAHVNLGDLIYQVREGCGGDWEAAAVKEWSAAVALAQKLTAA